MDVKCQRDNFLFIGVREHAAGPIHCAETDQTISWL